MLTLGRGARPGHKHVLVIGHDAYRAGSQICLLHLLRWLVANYPSDFRLLLRRAGELVGAYSEVLPTRVLPSRNTHDWRSILGRLAYRGLGASRRHLAGSEPVDLVYANSVPSLELGLLVAADRGCPLICHIHELDLAIHRFLSFERFREIQHRVDAFVAVSQAVATNLVRNHGVDAARIHQTWETIALPIVRPDALATSALREQLGIPPDAFVVGGCGTMDLRKAPEVFLQIARSVATSASVRPVHFLWVGGQTTGWEREVLDHDVARMGLGGIVHFVGPQAEPVGYFALFDMFLLTSREDPYPLVCLEAAALGIPTVCFADAGGIVEFVGADAGLVVPYLDVSRASDAIHTLMASDGLRQRLGRCAAERVQRHDVGVIGPQIAAVLDQYLR